MGASRRARQISLVRILLEQTLVCKSWTGNPVKRQLEPPNLKWRLRQSFQSRLRLLYRIGHGRITIR